jgi:hypothetical protein
VDGKIILREAEGYFTTKKTAKDSRKGAKARRKRQRIRSREDSYGSSLFPVGEVNQEVKIWNSRIACLAVACLAAS